MKYTWKPSRCSKCHIFGHTEVSHKPVTTTEVGVVANSSVAQPTAPVIVSSPMKVISVPETLTPTGDIGVVVSMKPGKVDSLTRAKTDACPVGVGRLGLVGLLYLGISIPVVLRRLCLFQGPLW